MEEEDFKYFRKLIDTHLDHRNFVPKNIPTIKSVIEKWISEEMKEKYIVAFGDSPSVCLRYQARTLFIATINKIVIFIFQGKVHDIPNISYVDFFVKDNFPEKTLDSLIQQVDIVESKNLNEKEYVMMHRVKRWMA